MAALTGVVEAVLAVIPETAELVALGLVELVLAELVALVRVASAERVDQDHPAQVAVLESWVKARAAVLMALRVLAGQELLMAAAAVLGRVKAALGLFASFGVLAEPTPAPTRPTYDEPLHRDRPDAV